MSVVHQVWQMTHAWRRRPAPQAQERQAAALEQLHRRAHADDLTGLLRRGPFVARLDAALQTEPRGSGLLLVRVRGLSAMNRRLGHAATDRLLAALAQVLQSYPRRVRAALAGRLNGSDFALYLPAAGICEETARSLAQALRGALATVDPQAELAVGAAELPPGCDAASALARCDRALAQAESDGAFAVSLAEPMPADVAAPGERAWHAQLRSALRDGWLRLAEHEVRDAHGALLHRQCALQLQFDTGGPFEAEARWRALALRCDVSAPLDLVAVDLALAAIGRDGRARGVQLDAASLLADGFVDDVARRLKAASAEAARLRIDVAEGAKPQPKSLQAAAAAWRRHGTRIGLALSGARSQPWPRLQALGLDHVRIDPTMLCGVGTEPAVRDWACGLLALLRAMQLQVFAGALDVADIEALHALGFDGVAAVPR